jgi:cytochrome c55X
MVKGFVIKSISVMSVFIFCNLVIAENNISTQRSIELNNLLVQDCGSCHGMTMKGGLGPALTPEVLLTKPRDMITATITHGRPGTPMPPWKNILSAEEINWMVDTLYAGVKQE